MARPSRKDRPYSLMNTKAAEHEPPPTDSFGVRCRKYKWIQQRLIHLMSESGCALLQHEADHMRTCGVLVDVTQTQAGTFAERTSCNRPACVCCGNRGGRISSNYIQLGIEFHRSFGNELFLVTTSYPPMARENAAGYFDMVRSAHRHFVQILADNFDPDWHVEFEVTESPTGLRLHAHYVIATPVNCPAPRKKSARRVAFSAIEAFCGSGQPLTIRRVINAIRSAGLNAICKLFPEAAAKLADASIRHKIVNIRRLRSDSRTPGRVAGYICKALPCGMTVKQLGSVSMDTLEELLGAIKPEGARRARKMSQSKAGSWFSRRPATSPLTRPRRKIPSPKAKPELRHAELLKLVDDFLSDQPLPASKIQWFENVGDVLAEALTNDGDGRGLDLCFKLMALRRVQQPSPAQVGCNVPLVTFSPRGSPLVRLANRPS
ncbi:MAG: hypothetical protein IT461_16250 [Planctomycetes bacterium]|nr:hypothetical protein [Planctomycetota bacterium]